jgi:2-phosphosulfolactate phosphatase
MRIDVLFGPSQPASALLAGRVVAVVDVLRACTTVAVALANGAKNIVPLESAEEVITRSKSFARADVWLAGEQKMLAISGFDAGNSPRDFSAAAVEGKTVLLSTTNGTATLVAMQGVGAREVVLASYVNFSATLTLLRAAARARTDISIVCAGRERQFSLEDAACAGRFVRHIVRRTAHADLNDAARACALLDRRYGDRLDALFADSEHGKALAAAGFAEDLVTCAAVDSYPVIPIYQDRQITKLGPQRER